MAGRGDGTFETTPLISPGTPSANNPVLADLDRDGVNDIVVKSRMHPRRLYVHRGLGGGTFVAPAPVDVDPADPPSLNWIPNYAVRDWNGDSVPDLLAYALGGLQLLAGHGDGTFAAAIAVPVTGGRGLLVDDFDLDGRLDVALADATSITVALQTAAGVFDARIVHTGQYLRLSGSGDLNGDRRAEILFRTDLFPALGTLLNEGGGDFVHTGRSIASSVMPSLVADLDGDRDADLLLPGGGEPASLLVGDGDTVFGNATTLVAGVWPNDVRAADLNADGRLDLCRKLLLRRRVGLPGRTGG